MIGIYYTRRWSRRFGRYVWKMYFGPRRITTTISLGLLAGQLVERL
jgi:hypothetical protein